jgi:hypothetical protein
VDLLVTEGQNEYVLEVNTLPGMTPTSLLPKIAASVGFDFTTLCTTIADSAKLHVARPRVEQKSGVIARPVVDAPVSLPAIRVA